MKDMVEIRVYVWMPWAKEEKAFSYAIDRNQAEKDLTPLPRSREVDYFSALEAERQHERRKRLVEMVSNMISAALMTACESEDTVNGYPRGKR